MKKLFLLFVLLVSCVPIAEQPKESAPQVQENTTALPQPIPRDTDEVLPTRTVKVSDGTQFKLTEDNKYVVISNADGGWEFKYENGRLSELNGKESYEFLYNRSQLAAIDLAGSKLTFRYDSRGRLVELKGGKETLYFDYDSLDLIRGVRRGVAGKTSIDYDKQGRIKYLTRGMRTVNVIYDDKGRLRNFDGDDVKMILGYWRDDKLISLSGKGFGQGLGVSYGPDYPPNEAKIAHVEDNSVFDSAYKDTLYKVVDEYLYCEHVRQLKDLLFEGESYAFYVNYFQGDMPGYLAMNVRCKVYE